MQIYCKTMKALKIHKVMIILTTAMSLLCACNDSRVADISDGLHKAEAMISSDEKDNALGLLLEIENNLDETIPDSLRYKVISRIGSIYYADFKKEKADEYFNRALAIARKCDDEYLSGALWNRCLSISDNDSILILLKECREVSHKCGMRYSEAMSGINLANAYAQLGDPDQAWVILEDMEEVVGDNDVLRYELLNARVSYLMGIKQFDRAKKILDSQKEQRLNLQGRLFRYQNLYTIEVEDGNYARALEYRDSIDGINEKIDSISYDEKLSKIESDFSSRLDKEREHRNLALIIGLCIIILLCVLLAGGIKRRRLMRKQLELNRQIAKLNLRISQLTEMHDDETVLAEEVKGDVQTEVIEKLRLNRELFITLPIYDRLKQLNLKRATESLDRTSAKEVLEGVIGQFADVCSTLRQLYAGMTYDDALYCSAIYVGFSKEVASAAFGASEDALRRRKSRIKQKLPPAVFEAIFATKV